MMIIPVKNNQTVQNKPLYKKDIKAELAKPDLKLKRALDPNNLVVSRNKRVMNYFSHMKEGAASVANKIYYFFQKNLEEGRQYVLTTLKVLSKQIGRSIESTRRYLLVLYEKGLIRLRMIRGKDNHIFYEIIPTDLLIEILTWTPPEKKRSAPTPPKKVANVHDVQKTHDNQSDLVRRTPQNEEYEKRQEPCFSPEDKGGKLPLYPYTIRDSLNNARARETLSRNLDLNPIQDQNAVPDEPTGEAETPVAANKNLSESKEKPGLQLKKRLRVPAPPSLDCSELRKAALEAIEIINAKRKTPLDVCEPLLMKTLKKLMPSHFGYGEEGRKNLLDYAAKCADNAFLMGQKAMKNGAQFLASIGLLLTPKIIEDSWYNTGYFNVFPSRKPKENPDQGGGDRERGSEPDALPALTLEGALEKASDPADKTIKETLYGLLGATTYACWFHGTGFEVRELADGKIDFSMASRFAKDYVLTNFEKPLKKAFEAVFGKDVASKLVCDFGGL